MRNALMLVWLTAVLILISPASRLSALTDSIQVHDDVIFINPGSGDPNALPAEEVVVPCPQTPPEMGPPLWFAARPGDCNGHTITG